MRVKFRNENTFNKVCTKKYALYWKRYVDTKYTTQVVVHHTTFPPRPIWPWLHTFHTDLHQVTLHSWQYPPFQSDVLSTASALLVLTDQSYSTAYPTFRRYHVPMFALHFIRYSREIRFHRCKLNLHTHRTRIDIAPYKSSLLTKAASKINKIGEREIDLLLRKKTRAALFPVGSTQDNTSVAFERVISNSIRANNAEYKEYKQVQKWSAVPQTIKSKNFQASSSETEKASQVKKDYSES